MEKTKSRWYISFVKSWLLRKNTELPLFQENIIRLAKRLLKEGPFGNTSLIVYTSALQIHWILQEFRGTWLHIRRYNSKHYINIIILLVQISGFTNRSKGYIRKSTMKCCIYCRVSTSEQELENQLLVLAERAEQRNFQVVKVYQEEESAWRAGHQR